MCKKTAMWGLLTPSFARQVVASSVLCCLPVIATAQPASQSIQVQVRVFLEGLLIEDLAIVASQSGGTFRDCATCPEMIVLEAGSFDMGSRASEAERFDIDHEEPEHTVTILNPFAVGKYEVTVGQYREFVEATNHQATGATGLGRDWHNPGFTQTDDHPVTSVSWSNAKAYVEWLSKETEREYRLLTEAEWEYAARAGSLSPYSFGSRISSTRARYWHCSTTNSDMNSECWGTVRVGSYLANGSGLHDVHGNLWEWVEDCWHDNYTDAPTDGSAWISGCDEVDGRVLRGGAWNSSPDLLRSANRFWVDQNSRWHLFGFRVARTIDP